jgi:CRP-like cAMP-binding protein
MPDELLSKVATGIHEERFQTDQTILVEGQPNDKLYIVFEGAVRIMHQGQQIAMLEKGQIFGDMSIMNPEATASASVVTNGTTGLLSLTRNDFFKLLKENPDIAQNMLRMLSRRLSETTIKLSNALRSA